MRVRVAKSVILSHGWVGLRDRELIWVYLSALGFPETIFL